MAMVGAEPCTPRSRRVRSRQETGYARTMSDVPDGGATVTAPGALGVVEIVRDTAMDVQDRWVRVRIDDGAEEIVRYGHTVRFDVPAGRHRLRAHNTLGRDALEFDLAPGEVLRVRCYNEFSKSAPLLILAIGFAFIKVRLEVISQG